MKTSIIRICVSIILLMLTFTSRGQTIKVRFPDTVAVNGSILEIPLYVDSSLTGKGVLSYQMSITYSSVNADILSVIHTGTLCAAYGAPIYNVNPTTGVINISSAGTTALSGTGILFKIRLQLKQVGGFYLNFNGGTAVNYFNQGLPAMNLFYGTVNSTAPPVITAYFASTAPLTMGDSVQVYVSGGTAPYSYSVTNPGVANITATGMLRSVAPGKTKVRVQSANSLVDTTDDEIEVRAIKISIPDTIILPLTNVVLPIRINSTNSSAIYSGSFRLDYNSTYMAPDSMMLNNTLLAGKMVTYQNFPGYTLVSFASTTALTGSGELLNIRFRILNPVATSVNIQNILLNQSQLANNKNGSISFVPVPTLAIYPGNGEFFASQTQQFTATGGKPPYQFFVSDTSKASMSTAGLLLTKKGGYITTSVKDSLNTIVTSGGLQIYDAALSFPSISALPNEFVSYPVILSNMTGTRSLLSFQVTINFPANTLDSIQVLLPNSLTVGWIAVQNIFADKIIIALAGTTPVNTNGVFFRIKAKVKPGVTVGTNIGMSATNILFNESDFYAKVSNGNINIVSVLQKDIGISSIQAIVSSCTKSNQETIIANITNYQNVVYFVGDTLLVGYKINNNSIKVDTIILSASLQQNEVLVYSFKQKADLSVSNSYTLKVMTQLAGDISRANDTTTITFQVYGNPIVNLGNDTTICSGGGFTLNATNSSSSYVWNTTATTPILAITASGTYWVKVTTSNNCIQSDTVNIVVNPKPITSSISGRVNVHIDTAAVYTVVNTAGSLYNWSVIGGLQIAGGQTSSISVDWDSLFYGQVRVIETNSFGCKGDTVKLTMVSVVPIELLSFSGHKEIDGVKIYWQTASETNNEKFEVERAADNGVFEKIGEVKGNGTTNTVSKYSYLDDLTLSANHTILQSSVLYYRLKQYDFDGKYAYSNTVSISDQKQSGESITVFPNPTTGVFTIRGITEAATLQDILGNTVLTISHDGDVDISGLEPGVYFVHSGAQKQKIVKH